MVMEVEVSDDEELEQIEPQEKRVRCPSLSGKLVKSVRFWILQIRVRKLSQAMRTSEEDAAEGEAIDNSVPEIVSQTPKLVRRPSGIF